MLGVTALLFLHVVAEWQQGRFTPALRWFARVHDDFLMRMPPDVYDRSGWPIRDTEVRQIKDVLLFNIRKFRAVAAEYGSAALRAHEDALLRENLQDFALHLEEQEHRRVSREAATSTQGTVEHVPAWELWPRPALAGDAPGLRAASQVDRLLVPPLRNSPPFRVFVYDESLPELAPLIQGPGYCHGRQWGMDVGFHDFFRTAPLRTLDPWEADFFFVPAYAMCLRAAGVLDLADLRNAFAALIGALPFFNRTRGRDHVFSLHYMDLFPGWQELAPVSIFLTPETEVSFERHLAELSDHTKLLFDPFKDVAIPPIVPLGHVLALHRNAKPIGERSHLVVFAGRLWSDVQESSEVRSKLHDNFGHKPGVKVWVGDSSDEPFSPEDMAELMGDACFCFVPRGRAAWSVRFVEALWSGCVPVILSDHYEVPFNSLFDVAEFAIKWPVGRIDDALFDYLEGLPVNVVEAYALAAQRVRCWYLYPPPVISWFGSRVTGELDAVESELCPGLSSSRNAFQAVVELLARRTRVSKTAMETTFYWPDLDATATRAPQAAEADRPPRLRVTDTDLKLIVPD